MLDNVDDEAQLGYDVNAAENEFCLQSLQILDQLRQQEQDKESEGGVILNSTTNDDSSVLSDITNNNSSKSLFCPETLIEYVRQFPCIWDCKLRSYKDHSKKKAAWDQITAGFDGMFSGI